VPDIELDPGVPEPAEPEAVEVEPVVPAVEPLVPDDPPRMAFARMYVLLEPLAALVDPAVDDGVEPLVPVIPVPS
jgi:hypothetical protein